MRAGYDDPTMWQATRNPAAPEHGVPAELLEATRTKGRARAGIVLDSYVVRCSYSKSFVLLMGCRL